MSLLNETVVRLAGIAAPPVSDAGEGRIYFDSGSNQFRVSQSGGAYAALATGLTAFLQGGNAFGTLATLGTTDANDLQIITNNSNRIRILSGGAVLLGATAQVGTETLRQTGGTTLVDFTSTTALQVTQTGGSTPALVVDTTNTRVGIAATPGAFNLDVTGTSRISTSLQTPQVQAASGVTLSLGGNASNQFALSGSTTGGNASALTQPVSTSGSPTAVLVTGGAHTTLAASTEASDVNWNLARTVQFSTGAIATQRAVRIQAPTYAFVGSSTITTAATVAISSAPVAGTNATITNAYSLWCQAGQAEFDGGAAVAFTANSAFQVATNGGSSVVLQVNTGTRSQASGALTIAPAAQSGGSPAGLVFTGAADTNMTASTEASSIVLSFGTRQFATGALTTQRAVQISAPTYGFVASSTITNAATVAIGGAPVAGSNATITNPYALWVQAGVTRVAGFNAAVVTKTANYTLTADDFTIRANNPGGGAITMTLPAVAGVRGQVFNVKRVNAGAGAANRVVIAAAAGETIDGAASTNLNAQYASLMVQAPDTGTDWMVI
jgi:hypothetical protein